MSLYFIYFTLSSPLFFVLSRIINWGSTFSGYQYQTAEEVRMLRQWNYTSGMYRDVVKYFLPGNAHRFHPWRLTCPKDQLRKTNDYGATNQFILFWITARTSIPVINPKRIREATLSYKKETTRMVDYETKERTFIGSMLIKKCIFCQMLIQIYYNWFVSYLNWAFISYQFYKPLHHFYFYVWSISWIH